MAFPIPPGLSLLSGMNVETDIGWVGGERVAGKVRVHELAKELGVPVKQLLLWVSEQGGFARSGSSTLPAPVARRLREAHGGPSGTQTLGAEKQQKKAADKQDPQKSVAKTAKVSKAGSRDARPTNGASGAGQITQYCVGCKSRTSIKGFDVGRGLCAECRRRARPSKAASSGAPKKPPAPPAGPKSWKCPNCLKRLEVDKARALVQHQNAKGQRCAGSGYQLPERSVDALDYRVAGSFEGGRR